MQLTIRHVLYESCVPLALLLAKKSWESGFARHLGSLADVQQEALLALWIAADRYNPNNPSRAKFCTYAGRVVWCELYRVVQQRRFIRLPCDVRFGEYDQHDHTEVRRLPEAYDRAAPEEDPFANEALYADLECLAPAERKLLVERYGLAGEKPHTLEQLGRKRGICKERARQVCDEAMEKLAAKQLKRKRRERALEVNHA